MQARSAGRDTSRLAETLDKEMRHGD